MLLSLYLQENSSPLKASTKNKRNNEKLLKKAGRVTQQDTNINTGKSALWEKVRITFILFAYYLFQFAKVRFLLIAAKYAAQ